MPPKKRGRKKKGRGRRRKKESDDSSDDEFLQSYSQSSSTTLDKSKSLLEGKWKYNITDKLNDPKFDQPHLYTVMNGEDLTMEYVKSTYLDNPICFRNNQEKALGMKIPNAKRFTVKNVEKCVGAKREVDVVEVATQRGKKMTVGNFVRYYRQRKRKKLLNILSLEFSHTELAELVQAPSIVKELDWVHQCWPSQLKIPATSDRVWMYPKVQNYCLMSVKDCYTDFHLDFGGTSVWYHVLKGEKVFWLVPASDQNIKMYEIWTLDGETQDQTFFGDVVEKCARISLNAGDTFFIPSGWIHGVYTPKDSLVFGGNFLHNYQIPMQLKVYESEQKTHIRKKFRYPSFCQMLWYVAANIVHLAVDRQYVNEEIVRKIVEGDRTFEEDDDAVTNSDLDATFESADMSSTGDDEYKEESIHRILEMDEESHQMEIELRRKALKDEKKKAEQLEAEMREKAKVQQWPEMVDFQPQVTKRRTSTDVSKPEMENGEKKLTEEGPIYKLDCDYLKSLTDRETIGFRALLIYLKKKAKTKQNDVPIPIEAPNNLLADFEVVVSKAENPNQVVESLKEEELKGDTNSDLKQESVDDQKPESGAEPMEEEQVIVRKYEPTTDMIPLGHKPLATALRRAPQMYVSTPVSKPIVTRVSMESTPSHPVNIKPILKVPTREVMPHNVQKRPADSSPPMAPIKDPRLSLIHQHQLVSFPAKDSRTSMDQQQYPIPARDPRWGSHQQPISKSPIRDHRMAGLLSTPIMSVRHQEPVTIRPSANVLGSSWAPIPRAAARNVVSVGPSMPLPTAAHHIVSYNVLPAKSQHASTAEKVGHPIMEQIVAGQYQLNNKGTSLVPNVKQTEMVFPPLANFPVQQIEEKVEPEVKRPDLNAELESLTANFRGVNEPKKDPIPEPKPDPITNAREFNQSLDEILAVFNSAKSNV